MGQAKPEDKALPRRLKECCDDPNMDAMCVYLLLSYIKFLNNIRPSLQQILPLLQLNLFERRDLLELLRGDPPEPLVSPNQADLVFS